MQTPITVTEARKRHLIPVTDVYKLPEEEGLLERAEQQLDANRVVHVRVIHQPENPKPGFTPSDKWVELWRAPHIPVPDHPRGPRRKPITEAKARELGLESLTNPYELPAEEEMLMRAEDHLTAGKVRHVRVMHVPEGADPSTASGRLVCLWRKPDPSLNALPLHAKYTHAD